MAKTLVLFAALILSLAAAYFSFSHLNKAITVQKTNVNLLENINRLKSDTRKTEDTITAQTKVKETNELTKSSKETELKTLLGQIAASEAELPRRQEKIARQEEEINNYDATIAEIKEILEDVNAETPEEIEQAINRLQQDKIAVDKELEEVQTAVAAAQEGVASKEDSLARVNRTIAERREGIIRNTFESTITAVNPDWGFAVVGAGRTQGMSAEQPLLVKRGNTYIARLAIVSLEDNQLIADIVPDSLAPGARVLPGDRVIVERANR